MDNVVETAVLVLYPTYKQCAGFPPFSASPAQGIEYAVRNIAIIDGLLALEDQYGKEVAHEVQVRLERRYRNDR